MKLSIKLLLGRNIYFCWLEESKIVSDGLITVGYCKKYAITANDAVIGSLYTNEANRGQGLASMTLLSTVSAPECQRFKYLYIDVDEINIASRKAIENAGFLLHTKI